MKTCKNCIYSKIIIPKNTNCPSEFVCSLSNEDFHDCISNDMWHFSSKVLDQPLEDDAMNDDLISRSALKIAIREATYNFTEMPIRADRVVALIDNSPSIDAEKIVFCKDCRHRDPEDKKCDCGCFERQGCVFPVADDYFCKFGARRYSEK